MKFLIYSDVHWSRNTSVLNTRGTKYSRRLELLLDSMNWAENIGVENNCDEVYCLGDFFDKPTLNEEELTALNDVKWNKLPHTFIVGNHESRDGMLNYNSTNVLANLGFKVIDRVTEIPYFQFSILAVPYANDDSRKSIEESWVYKSDVYKNNNQKRIVMSHNEIKGIQYGGYVSKSGMDIEDVENNCDICLNGHLHNSEKISDKIINVGSLSAHNYTNDSSKYSYGCWILDTDDNTLDFFENPYSINVYKFDINNDEDLSKLNNLKNNAVVAVKCNSKYTDAVQEMLDKCLSHKIIQVFDTAQSIESLEDLSVDHLQKFRECCTNKLGNDDIVLEELSEVCK